MGAEWCEPTGNRSCDRGRDAHLGLVANGKERPMTTEYQILFLLIDPPCKVILTIRWPDGEPLVEQINLANEKKRVELVERVCRDRPGLDRVDLSHQLADMAAKLVTEATEEKKPVSTTSSAR